MTHKFKIDIELEDGRYCEGCRCLRYFDDSYPRPACNNKYKGVLKFEKDDEGWETDNIPRLPECIEEHGGGE